MPAGSEETGSCEDRECSRENRHSGETGKNVADMEKDLSKNLAKEAAKAAPKAAPAEKRNEDDDDFEFIDLDL